MKTGICESYIWETAATEMKSERMKVRNDKNVNVEKRNNCGGRVRAEQKQVICMRERPMQ